MGPSNQGSGNAPAFPPNPAQRDPATFVNAFAHPIRQGTALVAPTARSSLLMSAVFADLDDTLPLVEITGDLSFVENDSRQTDREFAALVANTRPRMDVVPQQGSSVASVATLMPSDRPEATEIRSQNELAHLLIAPREMSARARAPIGPSQAPVAPPPGTPQQFTDDDAAVDDEQP